MNGGWRWVLILALFLPLLRSRLFHFLYIKRARYQLCHFYYHKHVTLLYMIMTEEIPPTYSCLYLSLLSTMVFFYFSFPPTLSMAGSVSSFNVHFKSYDPIGAFLPSLIQYNPASLPLPYTSHSIKLSVWFFSIALNFIWCFIIYLFMDLCIFKLKSNIYCFNQLSLPSRIFVWQEQESFPSHSLIQYTIVEWWDGGFSNLIFKFTQQLGSLFAFVF